MCRRRQVAIRKSLEKDTDEIENDLNPKRAQELLLSSWKFKMKGRKGKAKYTPNFGLQLHPKELKKTPSKFNSVTWGW